MWFIYDAEGCGFETFPTEDAARAALTECLSGCRGVASGDGEWPDYAEGIMIGKVGEVSHLQPVNKDDEDGWYNLEMKAV